MSKDRKHRGRPARDPLPPPRRGPTGGAGGTPPLDFDLAPFKGFPPLDLKADTDVGRFVLVLAAIFNDLKNAIYAGHLAQQTHEKTTKKTPAHGQLTGMKTHAIRVMFGVIRELMKEIRENKAAVDSQEFKGLLAKLKPKHREAWERLHHIAVGADKKANAGDATSQILERIRHNVAFHYNAVELAGAYERFFTTKPKKDDGSVRDRALLSDGINYEGSRFYFAEAAQSQLLISKGGLEQEALVERVMQTAKDVSVALKHIVMAYIDDATTVREYPEQN
jgi:hypothetical protein